MRAPVSTFSMKFAIPFSTDSPLFARIGFTLGIAIMSRRSCSVPGIRPCLRVALGHSQYHLRGLASKVGLHAWTGSVQGAVATWSNHRSHESLGISHADH